MKKLINRPADVVDEMLDGIVLLNHRVRRLPGHNVLVRSDINDPSKHKHVAVISGGGSGHEPAHAGYVGLGMLDAAVAGEVFTSPSPDAVLAAIRAVTGRSGAVLIVKNYTGDRLNFGLAAELARGEGYEVDVVIVGDDVALRDIHSEGLAGPRGLAGTLFVHKRTGAAAAAHMSRIEVAAEARNAAVNVGTMGVALSGCTVPAAGKPGFVLGDQEIELGLGIHGEPGLERIALEPADAIVDRLITKICSSMSFNSGERIALLVNNLGATPPMELAIVARHAIMMLRERGIVVERAYAGTFMTALEMAGVSISVIRLDDWSLGKFDAPTEAMAWPPADSWKLPQKPLKSSFPEPLEPKKPQQRVIPESEQGRLLSSAIQAAAHALIAAEPELTLLDQVVGDGDIGITLKRGAEALLEGLPYYPLDDPNGTLRAISTTMYRILGGTSGPLYAVFFERAATIPATSLKLTSEGWSDAFALGCQAIADLGGASEGERTMLDALLPASRALALALKTGESRDKALELMVHAAVLGAEATKTMSPKRGRSSYLGDRALGHSDPGAVAVSVWIRGIAKALTQP